MKSLSFCLLLCLAFCSHSLCATRLLDVPVDSRCILGLPGAPALPVQIVRVPLPNNTIDQSVRIRLAADREYPAGHFPVSPALTNRLLGRRRATGSATAWHGRPVISTRVCRKRSQCYASVTLVPFRRTAAGTLLRLMGLHLAVRYETLRSDTGLPSEKSRNLGTHAVHPYVIITTNAIANASARLDGYVSFLADRGWAPLVVTEDDYGPLAGQYPDTRAEKIRQWLITHYQAYGIDYVLLIGDPQTTASNRDMSLSVPMQMCWPNGQDASLSQPGSDGSSILLQAATDHFYADLTGNWDLSGDGVFGEFSQDSGPGGVDFTPEVWVGRIPVYSADPTDLDSVLQKIMAYSTSPHTDWRQTALLPMSFIEDDVDGSYLGEYMLSDYLSPLGYESYRLYMQGGVCADADSPFYSEQELLDGATVAHWQNQPYGLAAWWCHGNFDDAHIGYTDCEGGYLIHTADCQALDDSHPAFVFQGSCENGGPEPGNVATALLYQGAVSTVTATRMANYVDASWNPAYKYYCDSASIGYYYCRQLVTGLPAAQALFAVKTDMGDQADSGPKWQNLMGFNLYGDPLLSLEGHAYTGPHFGIDPASYHFGQVAPGERADTSFTISNSGDRVLEIYSQEINGNADFTIISGGGACTVAPGQSHSTCVRFAPVSCGSKQAQLRITHNDTDTGPCLVTLTGVGMDVHENNNTPGQAVWIQPGVYDAAILPAGDRDWYCFHVPQDAVIDVQGLLLADSDLNDAALLYGPGTGGTPGSFRLSDGDSGTGGHPRLVFQAPVGGAYYLCWKAEGSAPVKANTSGGYRFVLDVLERPNTRAVHRFFHQELGGHFFTTSRVELSSVLALSQYRYEGPKFYVYAD